jgi:dTDP-4-dehydrorhamnose 3,5-epimerase
MIFTETTLSGAYLVDLEKRVDDRGFFARTWCRNEFADRGLATDLVQGHVSVNATRGTLRGLHFQRPPHAEAKLIRCVRGAIYDVIVDLRRDSPTHGRWLGVDLDAASYRMLYVPADFAHGFQVLADDTEITYLVSAFYAPGAEAGIRYDDPSLAVPWPLPVTRISEKDLSWPYFEEFEAQTAVPEVVHPAC